MVTSGYQWLPVVLSGYQLSMVLNGYQWLSVVTCGSQWLTVVLNGSQWFSMVTSRIGSYRSPRPKQFCSDHVRGIAPPQSNLNIRTICSAFAVPTSPGICVLTFKMKF